MNRDNFYLRSKANYSTTETPSGEPDYVSYNTRTNNISSKYWYTDKGVIRQSDHWGQVKECKWFLDRQTFKNKERIQRTGFCEWKQFIELTTTKKNAEYINASY